MATEGSSSSSKRGGLLTGHRSEVIAVIVTALIGGVLGGACTFLGIVFTPLAERLGDQILPRTASVTGTLMREGEHLVGAEVSLLGAADDKLGPHVTNSYGQYRFTGVRGGSYDLEVSQNGHPILGEGYYVSIPGDQEVFIIDPIDIALVQVSQQEPMINGSSGQTFEPPAGLEEVEPPIGATPAASAAIPPALETETATATERATATATEVATEKATATSTERSVETASVRATERRATERAEERATETAAARATERMDQRATERAEERASEAEVSAPQTEVSLFYQSTYIGDSPDGVPMWGVVVWVEPYDESANIESVTYYLHPTFQPSVVTRYQSQNFRLDFDTWGSFEIQAVVTFNDGSQQTLTEYLELEP